jgi:hypothetical protein
LRAQHRAAENFSESRVKNMDRQTVYKDLNKIAHKYSDIENIADLESRIRREYVKAYEAEHDLHFSKMSWIERKFHGARINIAGLVEGVAGFASGVGTLGKAIKETCCESFSRLGGAIYGAGKGIVAAGVELVRPVAKVVYKAVSKAAKGVKWVVTHPLQALRAIKSGMDWMGGKLVDGVRYVWRHRQQIGAFLKSCLKGGWGLLKKLGRGVRWVVTHPRESLKAVWKAGAWVATKAGWLIKNALKGICWVGKQVGRGVYWVVTHPAQAVKAVLKASNFVSKNLRKAGLAVGRFAYCVVTNPRQAVAMVCAGWHSVKQGAKWLANSKVGQFAIGLCRDLGLIDLGVGLYNLCKAPSLLIRRSIQNAFKLGRDIGLVLTGRLSAEQLAERTRNNIVSSFQEVGDCLVKAGRALKGAVLLLGEVSGITDCVLCVKSLLKGDWMMAGMYAGFAVASAGSIVATVATAGAASASIAAVMAGRASLKQAAKQVLKTATKECFEKASKEVGESVTKRLAKHLSTETIAKLGREISDSSTRTLAKIVKRQGVEALTTKTTQKVCRETTDKAVQKMLAKAQYEGIVGEIVTEMLDSKMGRKELYQQLREMGYKRFKARGLSKKIVRGDGDKVVKEMLEEDITRQVKNYIEINMEKPFKERFEASLRGEIGEYTSRLNFRLRKASKEVNEALRKQAAEKARKEALEVDDVFEKLVREHVEAGWREEEQSRPGIYVDVHVESPEEWVKRRPADAEYMIAE